MTTTTTDRVQRAADIATGRVPAASDSVGHKVTGAKKDLSCSGSGPQWFRMVYRGAWRYVSDQRLPNGRRSSERRCSVHGEVFEGELVVNHDRGKPVDSAWLVCEPDDEGKVLVPVEFTKRRDGQLSFTLPTGDVVVLPNPRA